MYVNDIANMLDGWTRLRVQKYVDEENAYVTVFNGTLISIEDDHIVLWCDYVEDGD